MFKPINTAHAIVEMVAFIEFVPELRGSITDLMRLTQDLREEFPLSDVQQVYKFNIKMGGEPTIEQEPISSFALRRTADDGTPLWIMQVGPKALSVHCLDYTRWAEVWPRSQHFLVKAFQAIGAAPLDVGSVGLKVIDRFVHQGDEHDYSATKLFRFNTSFLPPKAFNSGARWHCHTGWFDPLSEVNQEVLQQLNIDASINLVDGLQARTVTIDHTLTVRQSQDGELSRFAKPVEGPNAPLNVLMQCLHAMNKRVLKDLLSEKIAITINLSGGSDG